MTGDAILAEGAFPELQDVAEENKLRLDIQGYEGPLDVLLVLAKKQKVDLLQISITELVDQYLEFIRLSQALRLQIAGDYLVIASWLAYLKSALLLPREEQIQEDPDPELVARRLSWHLARLSAMRQMAHSLMERPQWGNDFFTRPAKPACDSESSVQDVEWRVSLHDLLSFYGRCRTQAYNKPLKMEIPPIVATQLASKVLLQKLIKLYRWVGIDSCLVKNTVARSQPYYTDFQRSRLASALLASLELAKQGDIQIKQAQNFDPIYVRRIRLQEGQ